MHVAHARSLGASTGAEKGLPVSSDGSHEQQQASSPGHTCTSALAAAMCLCMLNTMGPAAAAATDVLLAGACRRTPGLST